MSNPGASPWSTPALSSNDILASSLVTGQNIPSGIAVYQTNLNEEFDSVTMVPEKNSGITNFTPSGDSGELFAANTERLELYIQNLSTSKLYVVFADEDASADNFNFILKADSSQDAGAGGILRDEHYTGFVHVSGESPRYIAWERTV